MNIKDPHDRIHFCDEDDDDDPLSIDASRKDRIIHQFHSGSRSLLMILLPVFLLLVLVIVIFMNSKNSNPAVGDFLKLIPQEHVTEPVKENAPDTLRKPQQKKDSAGLNGQKTLKTSRPVSISGMWGDGGDPRVHIVQRDTPGVVSGQIKGK